MSEKKTINQVSEATLEAIRRKGAISLPDRPSDENMTADDIKKALFAPVLDETNSAISELNRVVSESNEALNDIYDNMGNTANIQDSNNTSQYLKVWTGTETQYNAITTKSNNTLYFIVEN